MDCSGTSLIGLFFSTAVNFSALLFGVALLTTLNAGLKDLSIFE